MKMVQRSRKPSFVSQPGEVKGINQHKALAMGKQGPVGTVKKPGSKSSGGQVKIRSY